MQYTLYNEVNKNETLMNTVGEVLLFPYEFTKFSIATTHYRRKRNPQQGSRCPQKGQTRPYQGS